MSTKIPFVTPDHCERRPEGAELQVGHQQKGDVDSGPVTLDAGTYTLICDVPGHNNMKATLVVE